MIKPHEEHACNEHFRVLNFLYLRFQSDHCATCAIHSYILYATIAFISSICYITTAKKINFALIDSNNFSLLRQMYKEKERGITKKTTFYFSIRFVSFRYIDNRGSNFSWTKCFRRIAPSEFATNAKWFSCFSLFSL